jgi:hypothetical protein
MVEAWLDGNGACSKMNSDVTMAGETAAASCPWAVEAAAAEIRDMQKPINLRAFFIIQTSFSLSKLTVKAATSS